MWQAWTNVILGLWFFVAAFLPFSAVGYLLDDLIVGVLVCITGLDMAEEKPWQGWTASILGIWLMATAFAPNMQAPAGNMWNGIIVGSILIVVGLSARYGVKIQSRHQTAH